MKLKEKFALFLLSVSMISFGIKLGRGNLAFRHQTGVPGLARWIDKGLLGNCQYVYRRV